MNRISSIVHLSLRSYRTGRGGRTSIKRAGAGARLGEITMPDSEVFSKHFTVNDYNDPDDIDEFESDFQHVGKYDEMHEREMQIKKDKLLTQIVKRKYFKCEDPPMLTWAEKEQIRLLHAKDPIEWSEDRLSESFPATRETILKVLRAKWSPKNIKTVIRYEETIQKNWDLYRAGKLVVSAELRALLEKFKDRKIKPMEAEEIAKRIIKPKPTFPNPKSTLFSSIIQSYRDPDALDHDECNKKMAKQIESGVSRVVSEDRTLKQESMTFKEFLKNRVSNVQTCDETTPVDRVLVDEYKHGMSEDYKVKSLIIDNESPVEMSKKHEKMNLSTLKTTNEKSKDYNVKSLILESENPVGISEKFEKTKRSTIESTDEKPENSKARTLILQSESPVEIPKKIEKMKLTTIETTNEKRDLTVEDKKNSLDTGIIARHKKNDCLHSDYPEYIKIPAKKYKPGVTYRVEDRYYDDDGELLYRVPGLKS